MKAIRRSLVAAVALVVVAGCFPDDYPFEVPRSGRVDHDFIYVPAAGGPDVTAVFVRGTFNGWSGTQDAMTQQPDGSWRYTRTMDPGTYQYKYVFNHDGGWAGNMCAEGTWGNPPGGPVVPGLAECDGENAVLHIVPEF